nr:MGMT family protein [Corynebacterium incognita]
MRRVLDVVGRIPPGNVSSYGEVAKAAGVGARYVGRVLRERGDTVAWWRVVRVDGSSHDLDRAAAHWDREGIPRAGRAGERVAMERAALDSHELTQKPSNAQA